MSTNERILDLIYGLAAWEAVVGLKDGMVESGPPLETRARYDGIQVDASERGQTR